MRSYAPRVCGWIGLALAACRADAPEALHDSAACDAELAPCSESLGGAITFSERAVPGITALDVGTSESSLGHELGGMTPLAVGDVDGDGWLDLAVGDFSTAISVLRNQGGLSFTLVETIEMSGVAVPDGLEPGALSMSLTDRDGDALPELWAAGLGWVAVWPNVGGVFGDVEWVTTPDDFGAGIYMSFALGDVDGDHDLDVAVSPLGPLETLMESMQSHDSPPKAVTQILYDEESGWQSAVLGDPDGQTAATTLRFSDFNGDGDLDLMVPGDRRYPLSMWSNLGGDDGDRPAFVDVAGVLGIDTQISGMGIADADFNGDGVLDYGLTDIGPPVLFLSLDRVFFESAAAVGLVPERDSGADGLSGWALRFADFNNDGWLDAFQASGAPVPLDEDGCDPSGEGATACFRQQSDVLWMGADGAFVDVGVGTEIASEHHHFGAIPADLDDDGDLDLLVGGYGEPVHVYENTSEIGAWLDVDLAGSEAVGSRVVVYDGDRSWTREVANLSGPGQEPQRLHFGLGDRDTVERVEVWWLGGGSTILTDVPTRRRVSLVRSP